MAKRISVTVLLFVFLTIRKIVAMVLTIAALLVISYNFEIL